MFKKFRRKNSHALIRGCCCSKLSLLLLFTSMHEEMEEGRWWWSIRNANVNERKSFSSVFCYAQQIFQYNMIGNAKEKLKPNPLRVVSSAASHRTTTYHIVLENQTAWMTESYAAIWAWYIKFCGIVWSSMTTTRTWHNVCINKIEIENQ